MRGKVPDEFVLLYFSNTNAYFSYDSVNTRKIQTRRYQTTHRLRTFLRKYCPGEWAREDYFPDDWNLPSIGEVWLFKDRNVALLFKLTFGGK